MKETPLKQSNAEVISGPADGQNFEAAWENTCLDVRLLSDVGRKRQNNEDACMFCTPTDVVMNETRGVLIAVADGMGGALAGEHASHLALECLRGKYFDKGMQTLIPNALRLAVEAANAKIYEEASTKAEFAGMGTTLSALAILGDWAYMAQVGDSRIYLLRPENPLKQLTFDHSLVAEQIRNGLINEEEARNHSLKNLITRAVGIKDSVEVDLFAVQLFAGDTLLLCSDGLTNMVSDEDLTVHLHKADTNAAAKAVVENALEAGGHDNITVGIVRVTAPPSPSNYQQGGKILSFEEPSFFTRLRSLFTRV